MSRQLCRVPLEIAVLCDFAVGLNMGVSRGVAAAGLVREGQEMLLQATMADLPAILRAKA